MPKSGREHLHQGREPMRKVTDCRGRGASEEVYSEVAISQTRKSLAHPGYNAVQKFIGMRMRKMADHCFLLQSGQVW